MDKRLTLSVAETARALGISTKTAYTLIHRTDFPAFQIGRRVVVSRDGLREWVRKQEQTSEQEARP